MTQQTLIRAIALSLPLAAAAGVACAQTAATSQPPAIQMLPDAPSASLFAPDIVASNEPTLDLDPLRALFGSTSSKDMDEDQQQDQQQDPKHGDYAPGQHSPCHTDGTVDVDKDCKPVPLNQQQPKRILGFMPNFRSVSAGSTPHPPGWKYNFTVATRQAFDYSSFVFLFLTTISAEGLNEHPVLGKGVHGFYSYGWRGLADKTDGTYIGAWFLPSLLHEDTRYYAKGKGHSIVYRSLYVMSRQVVTRTYGGHDTPNIAGLGGKVLTQIISRTYYPTGATSFGTLAEKFGYSVMRDIAFTSIREFYPDIAAHYVQKHREKAARQSAADVQQSTQPKP